MTPEMKFAKELWDINPKWEDWTEMFGKKCIEVEDSNLYEY